MYLQRAREASALTIPTLVPEAGTAGQEVLSAYQSLGAEGVRSLASNLVLTILPMDLPFFRLEVPFEAELRDPAAKAKVQQDMALLEQRILLALEEMQVRDKFHLCCQYYLVSGLGVMDFRHDIPRVHRFENIRLRRDGRGNILCLLVREGVALEDLPETVTAEDLLTAAPNDTGFDSGRVMYTVLKRDREGRYETWQEVHDPTNTGGDADRWYERPGSRKTYKSWLDTPWVVVGFEWLDGEHYPRSYLDHLRADLDTYDLLMRATLEGAINAAQQRTFVRPGGMTDIDDILSSQNGAVLPGREEDIGSMNNRTRTADIQFAQQQVTVLEQRLSRQFLLFLSIRRDAERVTAEEIQQSALALRQGLGGSYAALAVQFQQHLVYIVLDYLSRDAQAKAIVEGYRQNYGVALRPRVIAGLEVLGRAEALQRQTLAMNVYAQLLGPEALVRIVHPTRLMDSLLAGAGSPAPAWLRSEEEVQALDAQAQQAAIIQQAAPEIIKQAGENARGSNG